jgi:hypothetical protein
VKGSLQVEQLETRCVPAVLTGAVLQYAMLGLNAANQAWQFTPPGSLARFYSVAADNAAYLGRWAAGPLSVNAYDFHQAFLNEVYTMQVTPVGSAAHQDASVAANYEYLAWVLASR